MEFKRVKQIVDDGYKFETAGDSFRGQYQKMVLERFGAKEQKVYLFMSPEKLPTRIGGTTILDRLMRQAKPGSWYEIIFTGEKGTGGGNTMKEFEIHLLEVVSPSPGMALAGSAPGSREPGQEG